MVSGVVGVLGKEGRGGGGFHRLGGKREKRKNVLGMSSFLIRLDPAGRGEELQTGAEGKKGKRR